MPKDDVAIEEIKALEDRRYRAMIAGDAAVRLQCFCSGFCVILIHIGFY
jgi:hypothetical protein